MFPLSTSVLLEEILEISFDFRYTRKVCYNLVYMNHIRHFGVKVNVINII